MSARDNFPDEQSSPDADPAQSKPAAENPAQSKPAAASPAEPADASDSRMRILRDRYVSGHRMVGKGEADKIRVLSEVYSVAEARANEGCRVMMPAPRQKPTETAAPTGADAQTEPRGPVLFATPDKMFAWHLRSLAGELGVAVRESDQALRNRCYDAHTLVTSFPEWVVAIEEGQIEIRHIRALLKAARVLPFEHWQEFGERVLEFARQNTAGKTTAFAEEEAATIAAQCYEESIERARSERSVTVIPSPVGGMATLYAYLPIDQAIAIDRLLTNQARILHDEYRRDAIDHKRATRATAIESARQSNPSLFADAPVESGSATRTPDECSSAIRGPSASPATFVPDERTTAQIKADVFAETLLSATPESILNSKTQGAARVTAIVNITVPVLSLLTGRVDGSAPALLDGELPMSFDDARQFAATAPALQRVLTHPITGHTVSVDTYSPDRSLRTFLRVRDATCRFPGCSRPAEASDIDHTLPYSEGGKTCERNLAVLCRPHHVQKHQRGWQLGQLGDGALKFTTPLGYETLTRPRRRGPQFRPTGEILGADPRSATATDGFRPKTQPRRGPKSERWLNDAPPHGAPPENSGSGPASGSSQDHAQGHAQDPPPF